MKNIIRLIKNQTYQKAYSYQQLADTFPDKNNDYIELAKTWDNLPDDKYLKHNYIFRKRRYSQLKFLSKNKVITKLDTTDYFQSESINKYAGGKTRKLDPISHELFNNTLFRELMLFSFSAFDLAEKYISQNWIVDVHQFRILALPNMEGYPTPEGIHRDGFPFGSIHLITRKNISGGKSIIHSLDGNYIDSVYLKDKLDSLFVVDTRVKHSTSPIEIIHHNEDAYRDVLIFGFHLPNSIYSRDNCK